MTRRRDPLSASSPAAALEALVAGGEAALPGLSLRALPVGSGKSATDYYLFATHLRGALALELWYAQDLIEPRRARRLLDDLLAVLAALAERPGAPAAELCREAIPALLGEGVRP